MRAWHGFHAVSHVALIPRPLVRCVARAAMLASHGSAGRIGTVNMPAIRDELAATVEEHCGSSSG